MPFRLCRTTCVFFALAMLATSPSWAVNSVGDLKQVESKVSDLVEKTLPCTVCVRSARGQGSGSGVIVSKEGLVLTAAHVTQAAGKQLVIIFPDGRKVKAKSLGANRGRDAGMAQITEEGVYPFVEIGKSANLKRNDWCVSLGHAGGFDAKRTPPVRLGRVLANGRFVVTDCTIVGGDSGGPLFDLDGKLIGIHSNIGVSLSQNQHVPVDVFSEDWERMETGDTWGSLMGDGRNSRAPVLGIQLNPEPDAAGAKLGGVVPNSPAAKAGLQTGDVVVSVDNKKVKSPEDVVRLVQRKRPGQSVNLKVKRKDETLDFDVKLVRASDLTPDRSENRSRPPLERENETDNKKKPQPNEKPDNENQEKSDSAKKPESDPKAKPKANSDQPAKDLGDAKQKENAAKPKAKGRSIEELMKAVRENRGRVRMTREEATRFQQHLQKRFGNQPGFGPPTLNGPDKWFQQVVTAYKPVVAIAADSTYRILVDDKQVALATAVSKNTLLTKASEISDADFEVELSSGKSLAGEVIETFATYDLALVRVDNESLRPVQLETKDNDLKLGTFLAAVGNSDEPAAIGLISVKPRDLTPSRGFLGIALEPARDGIRVTEVIRNSPAKRAGLKENDVITKIDGKAIDDLQRFIKTVGAHKIGDQIELKVKRGDEELTVSANIGAPVAPPTSRIARMNRMGGQLSDTREGFPLALQHDAPIRPIDCGGPLVNLDGDVIGINIARAGRIKSYAVPADIVQQLVSQASAASDAEQSGDEENATKENATEENAAVDPKPAEAATK